jgi:hypothetical protein
MDTPLRSGRDEARLSYIRAILAIALLWLVITLLVSLKWSHYVALFPMLLAYPWASTLRTRLNSVGLPQSRILILLFMLAVYFACLLLKMLVPEGRLLAPLAFALMHTPLVFLKIMKAGGPGLESEPGDTSTIRGPQL